MTLSTKFIKRNNNCVSDLRISLSNVFSIMSKIYFVAFVAFYLLFLVTIFRNIFPVGVYFMTYFNIYSWMVYFLFISESYVRTVECFLQYHEISPKITIQLKNFLKITNNICYSANCLLLKAGLRSWKTSNLKKPGPWKTWVLKHFYLAPEKRLRDHIM